MRATLNRTGSILGLPALAAGMLWGPMGTASAQEGGPYVGVTGMTERPEVFYEKTVDNTDPRNTSPSRGQVYRADDTAAGAAYAAGFLAGYRLPLGAGGAYLSPEADLTLHGGAPRGRFEGAGFSAGRDQLGESWPEDWSFEERRYTDDGSATRVVPYDDLEITVPLVLDASGASVLVSLLWHF